MWYNKYGLVTNTENGQSGNDLLYTAHYVAGLALEGKLSRFERDKLINAIDKYEVRPGLFNRAPGGEGGQQAHDDYIGLVSICSFFFPEGRFLSRQIYNYGASTRVTQLENETPKNKWVYRLARLLNPFGIKYVWNNVEPYRFNYPAWLAKRPEMLCTIQLSAHAWPGVFRLLYWFAFMFRGLFLKDKKDDNAFILRWHMALATRDSKIPFVPLIGLYFRAHLVKVWGGVGPLLHWNFGHNGHPLKDILEDKA